MVSVMTEPSVLHETRGLPTTQLRPRTPNFSVTCSRPCRWNVRCWPRSPNSCRPATPDLSPISDAVPGHVTAHLHALGPITFGIDLSFEMVALARRAHPDLRFDEGPMTALDLADGMLGGILESYPIIHTRPRQLPPCSPSSSECWSRANLLPGFFAGDDPLPQEFNRKSQSRAPTDGLLTVSRNCCAKPGSSRSPGCCASLTETSGSSRLNCWFAGRQEP
jgi:hypothetical protein